MPIEARRDSNAPEIPNSVGHAFLQEARQTLGNALAKIKHCLDQIDDQHVQWRPNESHNSIQNIILHLCGNVRQWIIHGVGGAEDVRNRPLEFSERRPLTKNTLLERIGNTVAEADATLRALDPSRLLTPRRIQGFDTYTLAAIWDSVSHFVGHTHQIVYVTRQLIGDSYVFQFVPATVEQGAPRQGAQSRTDS
jgi:hypothetical protein